MKSLPEDLLTGLIMVIVMLIASMAIMVIFEEEIEEWFLYIDEER